MHRFFVPPEWIAGSRVTLRDTVAHQIKTVLRMQSGDQIVVLDNAGWEYTVTLDEVGGKTVTGTVEDTSPAAGEPPVELT